MSDGDRPVALSDTDDFREFARRAFVTGTAVTMPVIVTLIVIGFVVNFVSTQLDPVVGFVTSTLGSEPASPAVLKLVAILTLVGLIFLTGVAAEFRSETSSLSVFFDAMVARIPGVGSLYSSLDEMSSLLLDSDTDSFREVKLVEFPVEGSYSIAFQTAETPDIVREATDTAEMVTVFLPMAPNPVMGGYVLHVAEDRVYDVDMTVEEGIQSIVSSGVATGEQTPAELPEDMLARVERRLDEADFVGRMEDLEQYAADASTRIEEHARERMGNDEGSEHLESGEGSERMESDEEIERPGRSDQRSERDPRE